jgi:hypothetical protein
MSRKAGKEETQLSRCSIRQSPYSKDFVDEVECASKWRSTSSAVSGSTNSTTLLITKVRVLRKYLD